MAKLKAEAYEDHLGFPDNGAKLADLRDHYLEDCLQSLKPNTVATYTIQLKRTATTAAHVKADAVIAYRRRRLTADWSTNTNPLGV